MGDLVIRLIPFDGTIHGHYIGKWITDPQYAHFFQGISVVPTLAECENYPKWIGHSVMMIHAGGSVSGMVSMCNPIYRNGTCELGVLVDASKQKSGIGREAGNKWVRYIFNIGFRKVHVSVVNPNLADMMTKDGWTLEGEHKNEVLDNGKYATEFRLSLFKPEL